MDNLKELIRNEVQHAILEQTSADRYDVVEEIIDPETMTIDTLDDTLLELRKTTSDLKRAK